MKHSAVTGLALLGRQCCLRVWRKVGGSFGLDFSSREQRDNRAFGREGMGNRAFGVVGTWTAWGES